jgi:hypothetical protein
MAVSTFIPASLDNGAGEPSPRRILGGVLTTALIAAPSLLLGRCATEIEATTFRVAASIIGGVIFMVVNGSLGEWLVHRYIMHRPSRLPLLRLAYQLHHCAHHWVHFPPHAYVKSGRIEYPSILSAESYALCGTTPARALTITSYAVFYYVFALPIVAAGWFLTSNSWFAAASVATAAVLVFLFIRVHDAMHFPGVSRFERFNWFWLLDHHHYVHHIDNRANTNFLLPLGDLVMGTLRLAPDETKRGRWPTYEEARRLPAKARRPSVSTKRSTATSMSKCSDPAEDSLLQ